VFIKAFPVKKVVGFGLLVVRGEEGREGLPFKTQF
jgi:hypothetical protein